MFESLNEYFNQILTHPLPSLLVVLNLILIESLLSVDNAAVLATMVLDLPKEDRPKALRYGILGAYFFRGICLVAAAWLIHIWWAKPVGGAYLLYVSLQYFLKKKPAEELAAAPKRRSRLYTKTVGALGPLWSTILLVEMMDLAFSIDNVIAANAYTRNLILIWVGVFIGILAMRFVAQGFVRLMEHFPFLERCAYLVIGLLGTKLLLSLYTHFYPCSQFSVWLEGDLECRHVSGIPVPAGYHPVVWGDTVVSILSILLFLVPLFFSWLAKRARSRRRS